MIFNSFIISDNIDLNKVKIETNVKFDVDAIAFVNDLFAIKPAAPLLARVIRRVFFCPDGKSVGEGEPE